MGGPGLGDRGRALLLGTQFIAAEARTSRRARMRTERLHHFMDMAAAQ